MSSVIGAEPAVSCVDGGVARQQQLDDGRVTSRDGYVQGGLFPERTRNQEQNVTGTTQQTIVNAYSSNSVGIGAEPAVSCVDGGVARQQQLDDGRVTSRDGVVQRVLVARGAGNQEQL